MKQPFNPKRVETKQPRGPRTTGVLPFYKSVKQGQRVDRTIDVWEGRVFVDLNADGELLGVEIV